MSEDGLDGFQDRLGHRFADPSLLRRALTHSSVAAPGRRTNERLEFLGDRVLGLAIAEAMLAQDEAADEGRIAPRYNALVRKETCAEIARAVGIGAVLRLGRSEMQSGGRRKSALLGDAMEAVLGAVYQDAGFGAARALVLRHWAERIDGVAEDARDAKTALQEWSQANLDALPVYEQTARTGPDHAPRFTIRVRLRDGREATGTASAKREAEQSAGRALLQDVQGA